MRSALFLFSGSLVILALATPAAAQSTSCPAGQKINSTYSNSATLTFTGCDDTLAVTTFANTTVYVSSSNLWNGGLTLTGPFDNVTMYISSSNISAITLSGTVTNSRFVFTDITTLAYANSFISHFQQSCSSDIIDSYFSFTNSQVTFVPGSSTTGAILFNLCVMTRSTFVVRGATMTAAVNSLNGVLGPVTVTNWTVIDAQNIDLWASTNLTTSMTVWSPGSALSNMTATIGGSLRNTGDALTSGFIFRATTSIQNSSIAIVNSYVNFVSGLYTQETGGSYGLMTLNSATMMNVNISVSNFSADVTASVWMNGRQFYLVSQPAYYDNVTFTADNTAVRFTGASLSSWYQSTSSICGSLNFTMTNAVWTGNTTGVYNFYDAGQLQNGTHTFRNIKVTLLYSGASGLLINIPQRQQRVIIDNAAINLTCSAAVFYNLVFVQGLCMTSDSTFTMTKSTVLLNGGATQSGFAFYNCAPNILVDQSTVVLAPNISQSSTANLMLVQGFTTTSVQVTNSVLTTYPNGVLQSNAAANGLSLSTCTDGSVKVSNVTGAIAGTPTSSQSFLLIQTFTRCAISVYQLSSSFTAYNSAMLVQLNVFSFSNITVTNATLTGSGNCSSTTLVNSQNAANALISIDNTTATTVARAWDPTLKNQALQVFQGTSFGNSNVSISRTTFALTNSNVTTASVAFLISGTVSGAVLAVSDPLAQRNPSVSTTVNALLFSSSIRQNFTYQFAANSPGVLQTTGAAAANVSNFSFRCDFFDRSVGAPADNLDLVTLNTVNVLKATTLSYRSSTYIAQLPTSVPPTTTTVAPATTTVAPNVTNASNATNASTTLAPALTIAPGTAPVTPGQLLALSLGFPVVIGDSTDAAVRGAGVSSVTVRGANCASCKRSIGSRCACDPVFEVGFVANTVDAAALRAAPDTCALGPQLISFCSPLGTAVSDMLSLYMATGVGPNSACVTPNNATGNCSCPGGTSERQLPLLAAPSLGTLSTTNVTFCAKPSITVMVLNQANNGTSCVQPLGANYSCRCATGSDTVSVEVGYVNQTSGATTQGLLVVCGASLAEPTEYTAQAGVTTAATVALALAGGPAAALIQGASMILLTTCSKAQAVEKKVGGKAAVTPFEVPVGSGGPRIGAWLAMLIITVGSVFLQSVVTSGLTAVNVLKDRKRRAQDAELAATEGEAPPGDNDTEEERAAKEARAEMRRERAKEAAEAAERRAKKLKEAREEAEAEAEKLAKETGEPVEEILDEDLEIEDDDTAAAAMPAYERAAVALRFPNLSLKAFLYGFQGLLYQSLVLVRVSDASAGEIVIGSVGLVVSLVFLVFGQVWGSYAGRNESLREASYVSYKLVFARMPRVARLLLPPGFWLGSESFVRRYGPLYESFVAKHVRWVVSVYQVRATIVAVLIVIQPSSDAACSAVTILLAITFFVFAFLFALARPHRAPVNDVIAFLLNVLSACIALYVAVGRTDIDSLYLAILYIAIASTVYGVAVSALETFVLHKKALFMNRMAAKKAASTAKIIMVNEPLENRHVDNESAHVAEVEPEDFLVAGPSESSSIRVTQTAVDADSACAEAE